MKSIFKSNKELHHTDKQYYLQSFRRFPVALERGEGSWVWDVEGNKYLDLLAGIAVNNVGHCHPRVVEAIRRQAGEIIQVSNFFASKQQVALSERLISLGRMPRIFFTNSGAESVEGAIKIARKYAHSVGRGGTILSFGGAFHGRTLATVAAGKQAHQKGFEPIPGGFVKLPFNDMEAVEKAVDDSVGGILLEPVQGEGGIHVANKDFIRDLRRFTRKHDIPLIFDEVQCGIGRTGYWFAKEYFGVCPDIMALAKGLGGGAPVGAILSDERVSAAIDYGDHGTTFGGNPLVCAAALATLDVIEDENLLEKATTNGLWLREQIQALDEPAIREVRGLGLMIGVEFDFEVKPLVQEMLKHGVIANGTAGNVLRMVPPLNISREDLEHGFDVMKTSLSNIVQHA